MTMLIGLAILIHSAKAVTPPPDGGYANHNTAEGEDALFSLMSGSNNTAVGYHALYSITDSNENTAVGYLALANAVAGPNTAVGSSALGSNTTGYNNTAISGLYSNTTGHDNTSVGIAVLSENTTGSYNTAMGTGALGGNGNSNTAIGDDAMLVGGGDNNVAIGVDALLSSRGNNNVAVGFNALLDNEGSNNIAIGEEAGANVKGEYNDNILIGSSGIGQDSATIRIGDDNTHKATFIAGIDKVTVPDGVEVFIDNHGQLGTLTSSARYKDAIEPMADTSKVIYSLQPVSFTYKQQLDPKAIPQFGLVAEEVGKIDPDLVVNDAEGKPYSVRYQAVNAMLLNEFLKQHQELEARAATIKSQQENIEHLEATLARTELMVREQGRQIRNLAASNALRNEPSRFVKDN